MQEPIPVTDSRQLALAVRLDCLQLCHQKKASHLGGALSVADILAVLYQDVLRKNPSQPEWEGRDRLFYSKGHACTAIYTVLANSGYYPRTELDRFTDNGSPFTSHVNHKVPGVELSTGSLGHALSVACGTALAGKRKKADWHTYAVLSDGELDEGSNWEAILFAPHHGLNNLTLIVDYNKIQSFGSVEQVLNLEPLADKLRAFNWDTVEVDGHDHATLKAALEVRGAKPRAIVCHTVKGKGISFMEHKLAWHYSSPNADQVAQGRKELLEAAQ